MHCTHYWLARIVVAAAFAEVMRPEDAALKSHNRILNYCTYIQYMV